MNLASSTQGAVISCNVSYKKQIDVETLVGILSGKLSPEPWIFHLDIFFNELTPKYINGVMSENNLSLQDLQAVFESLPHVFQSKKFKDFLNG
jgi:hypothetical protein